MARITAKITADTSNRVRIGGAPVIGPALTQFANTASALAQQSLTNKRMIEAEAAAEKITFERDENGQLRPPKLPKANGVFGPSLAERAYTEQALVRYREQLALDGTEKMSELARQHKFDPEGYSAAADAYIESTLDNVLPNVQGSVSTDLESRKLGHLNTINREVATRDFKLAIDTHAQSVEAQMNEVEGVLTSMPDNHAMQAQEIQKYINLINWGEGQNFYSEGQSARAIAALDRTIAFASLSNRLANEYDNTDMGRAEMLDYLTELEAGRGEITIPTLEGGKRVVKFAEQFPSEADRIAITKPIRSHIASMAQAENAINAAQQAAELRTFWKGLGKQAVSAHAEGLPVDPDLFTSAIASATSGDEINFGILSSALGLQSQNNTLMDRHAVRNEQAVITQGNIDIIDREYQGLGPELQALADDMAESFGATDFMGLITNEPDENPGSFMRWETRAAVAQDIMRKVTANQASGSLTKPEREMMRHLQRYNGALSSQISQWEKRTGKSWQTDATQADMQEIWNQTASIAGRMTNEQTEDGAAMVQELTGISDQDWFDPSVPLDSLVNRVDEFSIIPRGAIDLLEAGLSEPLNVEQGMMERAIDLAAIISRDPVLYGKLDAAVGLDLAKGIRAVLTHLSPGQRNQNKAVHDLMQRAITDERLFKTFSTIADENPKLADQLAEEIKDQVDNSMIQWFSFGAPMNVAQKLAPGRVIAPNAILQQQALNMVVGMAETQGYDLTDSSQRDAAISLTMTRLQREQGWAISESAAEDAFARNPDALALTVGTRLAVDDSPMRVWSQYPIEFFLDDPADLKAVYSEAERVAREAGITDNKLKIGKNLFMRFNGMVQTEDGTLPSYMLMARTDADTMVYVQGGDFNEIIQTTFASTLRSSRDRRMQMLQEMHEKNVEAIKAQREGKVQFGDVWVSPK